MSENNYPVIERVFLAQPRKKKYAKAMWIARPIVQDNLDGFPRFHNEWLGYSHEPFHLYVHISVLDKLEQQIKDLKQQLENNSAKQQDSFGPECETI